MRIKLTTALLVILLILCLQVTGSTAYRQIGGYVYEEEPICVDMVWNFISKFNDSKNSWELMWGMNWSRDQYYYCETFQWDDVYHHMRVDFEDFSFYCGHGSPNHIGMRPGEGIWLPDCPGYGDLANNGDLEFLAIYSCSVVLAPPDVADWWSKWWPHDGDRGIFQGMHQLLGFRTSAWPDDLSSIFADRIIVGQPVWQAWFAAINDVRAATGGGLHPGMASAIMSPRSDGDSIYFYSEDPPMNEHWLRIYWQE